MTSSAGLLLSLYYGTFAHSFVVGVLCTHFHFTQSESRFLYNSRPSPQLRIFGAHASLG